jgi:hypothetical protein
VSDAGGSFADRAKPSCCTSDSRSRSSRARPARAPWYPDESTGDVRRVRNVDGPVVACPMHRHISARFYLRTTVSGPVSRMAAASGYQRVERRVARRRVARRSTRRHRPITSLIEVVKPNLQTMIFRPRTRARAASLPSAPQRSCSLTIPGRGLPDLEPLQYRR